MSETKICPHCGGEILAIAKKCKHCGQWLDEDAPKLSPKLIRCPFCDEDIPANSTVCPECGEPLTPVNPTPEVNIHQDKTVEKEAPVKQPEVKEPQPIPEKPSGEGGDQEPEKKIPVVNPILLSILLAFVILSVGGLFVYTNVIKPRQIDKAAPRYYTFAPSVVLRSSKSSGADFNKIGSLPYGTELITYNYGYEWSEVKVNSVNAEGEKLKGYIASSFILNKSDFFLLNSIFGDVDSKSVIETSKCRRSLLNYFKGRNYIGRLSAEESAELGLPMPTQDNQWQVYCLPKDVSSNNVYYKRVFRKDSKFTDFAVIIKNINTGDRKLLYFYFDDDETPHLAAELTAPEHGTIKKITLKTVNEESFLMVDYTE